MDVMVDGDKNFLLNGKPADVFETVVAIANQLHEKGRSIMSVKVDGLDIPAEKLVATLQGKPLGGVASIEVLSEDTDKLVGVTLAELEDVLPELPVACHEIAMVFQGKTPGDGFEAFERLAEIWETVKAREYQVASVLGISFETLQIDGKTVEAIHHELNGCLEEAAAALRAEDCVLLADLLEYEMAPRAEIEAKIVSMLRARSAIQAD